MNRNPWSLRALVLFLGGGAVLGLIHVLSVIGLHIPFDPNEGWNAYFAQAVVTTGSPYPARGGWMIDNYPPLSFYLVGTVGRLIGDMIVAGRLVSLAAFVATAFGITEAARRMGCSAVEAAFAALFFAAGILLSSDYVGMDDPQMLGHAVAILGLLVVLREPRLPRAMVGAALLFTVAFFVKHNLILLPAALAVWLTLLDRRLGATFVLSGIVFLLLGLGLFKECFGFSLFGVIQSARSYSLANLETGMHAWLRWSAIPLLAAAALFVAARRDRYVRFAVFYAAIASLGGLYFLGGAGVDANAMFDADIALALCAALLLNRFPASQTLAPALYAVPLVMGLIVLDQDWQTTDYWLRPMAEDRTTAQAEIRLIRDAKGPALCEMLSLCYWAGKDAAVDMFNLEQAYLTGARRDDDLVHAIAVKRFGSIQLESLTPFPLTAGVHRAIDANYRIVRQDDDRVFFILR